MKGVLKFLSNHEEDKHIRGKDIIDYAIHYPNTDDEETKNVSINDTDRESEPQESIGNGKNQNTI